MKIILDQIMPKPLASIPHGPESIWGKKIEIESSTHILLNASSGRGKSTFTSIVFGLRNDYSGDLYIDGRKSSTFTPTDWSNLRQRRISAVFQDLQLFPKLTVKENLILKNDITNTYQEEELLELLEHLEIGAKWEQNCGLLSMGQQQRVAIIRALVQPYEWLLLDEPFSHLDTENAQRCLELIHKRTTEQNAGFILTTLGNSHGYEFTHELKL